MYCYQHTNGHVITKPDLVVETAGGPASYFTGPFVRHWWRESDHLQPIPTLRPAQNPRH